MRPQADLILRTVATDMLSKYLPGYTIESERADFGLKAIMVLVVSEEFDRAAYRRIEENNAIRNIFKDALPVVKDEDLKRRIKEAMEKIEDDYHISALDQLNCELQEVLIDLHAHVEILEGSDARMIEETIWKELENWTKRREFMIWQLIAAMMNAG